MKNTQEEDEVNPHQIDVELTDEIAEGVYSNLVMFAHSTSEFVIDFIRLMPGVPKAKVKSRIILTPEHAKRMLAALKDNVDKYEAHFGKIKIPEESQRYPTNFSGTIGEA